MNEKKDTAAVQSPQYVPTEWRKSNFIDEVKWETITLDFEDTYQFEIFLHLTDDLLEVAAFIEGEQPSKVGGNPSGYFTVDPNGYMHIVMTYDSMFQYDVVAHEFYHAISHLTVRLGLATPCWRNDEPQAYLMSGLMRKYEMAVDMWVMQFMPDFDEQPTMMKMWEETPDDVIVNDGSYGGSVRKSNFIDEVKWETITLDFEDTYQFEIFLHLTDDLLEVAAFIEGEQPSKVGGNPSGYFTVDPNGYMHIVMTYDSMFQYDVVAHEFYHAISHLTVRLGLATPCWRNDEPQAYLMSGLMRKYEMAVDMWVMQFMPDFDEQPTMMKMWEETPDDVIVNDGSYGGSVVDVEDLDKFKRLDRVYIKEPPANKEIPDGYIGGCDPIRDDIDAIRQYPLTYEDCICNEDVDKLEYSRKVRDMVVWGNYLLERRQSGDITIDNFYNVTDADIRNFEEWVNSKTKSDGEITDSRS